MHEWAAGFEVCQMKGTNIGTSELTLFKSYEISLLRIRPLCFWTLRYGPKAQWSISQKPNFIGFKQGQFCYPYICTFHLAYFKSGCQFMRVRPLQGRTVCRIEIDPHLAHFLTKRFREAFFRIWLLVQNWKQR